MLSGGICALSMLLTYVHAREHIITKRKWSVTNFLCLLEDSDDVESWQRHCLSIIYPLLAVT